MKDYDDAALLVDLHVLVEDKDAGEVAAKTFYDNIDNQMFTAALRAHGAAFQNVRVPWHG